MCRVRASRYQQLFIVLVLLVCIMCVLVIRELSSLTRLSIRDNDGYITYFPDVNLPSKAVKKIILWTPSFLENPKSESTRQCLSQCDVRCEVTDDKSEADDADAFQFTLSNVWTRGYTGGIGIGTKSTIAYPTRRNPHQVWILFNMEPLMHLRGDLSIFNGVFNWTKWHRLDSDIPCLYGNRQELSVTEKAAIQHELKNRNYFEKKTKDMFVRVSNCYDSGQRYKLVHQLNKHFNIDKFGYCYNNKCGYRSCGKNRLKQYRFHLAFENSHCKDYVTEKYWQTLARDQIPIVNWKHGSPRTVIPNSYINLFDFNDISDAIEYIKRVNSNETLYNSYFHYKLRYKDEIRSCTLCTICQALHNDSRQGQVYSDLEWWVRNDTCEKGELWNIISWSVKGFLYYTSNFGVYW